MFQPPDAQDVREHPCALEDGTFEHNWTMRTDWDGDPGVINGTRTWQTVVCSQCGTEQQEVADDERHN